MYPAFVTSSDLGGIISYLNVVTSGMAGVLVSAFFFLVLFGGLSARTDGLRSFTVASFIMTVASLGFVAVNLVAIQVTYIFFVMTIFGAAMVVNTFQNF